ncbi:hypothetical protein NOLU111490_01165 [Novosphingobium lubricantis]
MLTVPAALAVMFDVPLAASSTVSPAKIRPRSDSDDMLIEPVARPVRPDVTNVSVAAIEASPSPPPIDLSVWIWPPAMSWPAESTMALPTTSAAAATSKPSKLPDPSAMVIASFFGTATM